MLFVYCLFPHVTRFLDSTILTSIQSSLNNRLTPSRHHHEPLQPPQHPPNASTASSSSPTLKKHSQLEFILQWRLHSSPSVREARGHRHYRPQTLPQRFVDASTSCFDDDELLLPHCCIVDFNNWYPITLTLPRRQKVLLVSPSRPQRLLDARLDDEQLQRHPNAAADNSGSADNNNSRLNSLSQLIFPFTSTTFLSTHSAFILASAHAAQHQPSNLCILLEYITTTTLSTLQYSILSIDEWATPPSSRHRRHLHSSTPSARFSNPN